MAWYNKFKIKNWASSIQSVRDQMKEQSFDSSYVSTTPVDTIIEKDDGTRFKKNAKGAWDKVSSVAETSALANALSEQRRISLSGDASGYVDFDGSTDVTLPVTVSAINDLLVTGDLDLGPNKILFSNHYHSINQLPSASDYHGMFAHVHSTGKAYFAHSGSWVELANQGTIPTDLAHLTDQGNLLDQLDLSDVTQHIIPSQDNVYDLGSPTKRWRDLYLGPGSLYVNNKKVISDESDTMEFKTDRDQSLSVKTSGTGVLTLQSDTTVNFAANLQIASGKAISSNDGTVTFSDKVDLDNNQMINVGAPTAAGHAATKGYVDQEVANLINGAPGTLDTLNELANALGDDANFASTMTTALASKASITYVDSEVANIVADVTANATAIVAANTNITNNATAIATANSNISANATAIASNATAISAETANRLAEVAAAVSSASADATAKANAAQAAAEAYTDAREAAITTAYQAYANSAVQNGQQDLTPYALRTDLFSGNYNDLTNKPTIPTVPTNVSAFTNDAGYLTNISSLSTNDLSEGTNNKYYTDERVDDRINALVQAGQNISVVYNDALNTLTISAATQSGGGFDLSNNTTDDVTEGANNLYFTAERVQTIIDSNSADFATTGQLFSGNYNDLTNKPTIPTVPTSVSEFTNDAGYLTSHQDLSSYATQSYVDTAVNNLVNGADAAFDTLKEIQDAMATDAELASAISNLSIPDITGLATETYVNNQIASNSSNVTISTTAPSSPSNGDLWWDSEDALLNVYYENVWVGASSGSSQISDGPGSGLNADLLDGQHASAFATIAGSNTYTGTNRFSVDSGSQIESAGSHTTFPIEVYAPANTDAAMAFHIGGDYAGYFGLDYQSNDLFWGGWSVGSSTKHRIWHAGNDGAGSGLDADTVDGKQASDFLLTTGKAADSDKLDGINSSQFVRNDVNAQTIARHLDANTAWGGGDSLFLGWYSDKVIIGNDTNSVHNTASGYSNNSIILGNATYCHSSITAAGDVTAFSDERLKTEIKTIDGALYKVNQLRGVTFEKDGQASTGVIAQEIEKIVPELVHTGDDELGIKSVAYGNMAGLFIEAIKEIDQKYASKIANLEAQIEELKRNG